MQRATIVAATAATAATLAGGAAFAANLLSSPPVDVIGGLDPVVAESVDPSADGTEPVIRTETVYVDQYDLEPTAPAGLTLQSTTHAPSTRAVHEDDDWDEDEYEDHDDYEDDDDEHGEHHERDDDHDEHDDDD